MKSLVQSTHYISSESTYKYKWLMLLKARKSDLNGVDWLGTMPSFQFLAFYKQGSQHSYRQFRDNNAIADKDHRQQGIRSMNCITVMSLWAQWHLKSLVSQLFAQPFVQVQIKENIKAPCHWPWWGESTSDQWMPLTKGQKRR